MPVKIRVNGCGLDCRVTLGTFLMTRRIMAVSPGPFLEWDPESLAHYRNNYIPWTCVARATVCFYVGPRVSREARAYVRAPHLQGLREHSVLLGDTCHPQHLEHSRSPAIVGQPQACRLDEAQLRMDPW